MVCASFVGDKKETVMAPVFNCEIASFSNGRTVAITSAEPRPETPATVVAPTALYSSS